MATLNTQPLIDKQVEKKATEEKLAQSTHDRVAHDNAEVEEMANNWKGGKQYAEQREKWLQNVPQWFHKHGLNPQQSDIDICHEAVGKQLGKWQKRKLNKEGPDIEDHTVGPALRKTFLINNILWLFFLSFPWSVGYLMTLGCGQAVADAKPGNHSLALVPYPLWIWLPFFALVGILSVMEAKVARYAVVAQVMTGGVPFGGRFSYKTFLYMMIGISVCYHFDIFTNGVYMARVYATEQCMAGDGGPQPRCEGTNQLTIECIWFKTMQSSKAVGGTFIAFIPYWGWAVFAWASLLLQPLYAFCYAYPRSPELQEPKDKSNPNALNEVSLEDKKVAYDSRGSGTDCSQYHVVFRSDQQHGRALQAISECARMNSVYFLDPAYMHWQVKTFQPNDVHREMQRCNLRFFIFVIETVFPPNLQASFLCMEKAIAGKSDYIIFASVAGSFLVGCFYVYSELTTVFNYHRLVNKQKDMFDVQHENALKDQMFPTRMLQFKASSAVKAARRSRIICVLMAIVGIYMLLQAVTKAYMGAFVCECGMWNNKGFPLSAGCVAFETFKVPTACGRSP